MFCEIKGIVFKIKILTCLLLCRSSAPRLYLRCHCYWSVIVLNSNFEQRFLHVLYPLLLLFYDVVIVTIL